MDQTVEPMSKEEYKEAILSNIQNMDKNQYDYDKTKDFEVSSKEFIDYINQFDSAKLEDRDYYKKINENLEIALCIRHGRTALCLLRLFIWRCWFTKYRNNKR